MRNRATRLAFGLVVVSMLDISALRGEPPATTTPASRPADVAVAARSAAQVGLLVFRLTTPAELKALLGAPEKQHAEKDGDGKFLIYEYPGVQAGFGRLSENAPYVLFQIAAQGTPLDIGRDRIITLRSIDDLAKLDTFWGVANVSLVRLDLTEQKSRLDTLPLDNRTQWPAADKLPKGFDPARLLEEGKNPGLGIRKLHAQGIDGRTIHIAIIDQPLLREHREYKDRVVQYEPIDVADVEPQMHGSPVTSIAVGKSCGTAPAASVHYYAAPMWKWWDEHCKPYAATVDRIVEQNKKLPPGQKVRVISISLGAFSQWPDHGLWVKAVKQAADEGILVVSCDPADLRITILKRNLAKDVDSPSGYSKQLIFSFGSGLGVPAGNRTTAEYSGKDDYIFWRDGGMSWTVPYLAGVAALAFQVDPDIKPQTIKDLWMKTARKTSAGLVLDPPAFIEAVKAKKTD
jgi:subtilisin family serine protease